MPGPLAPRVARGTLVGEHLAVLRDSRTPISQFRRTAVALTWLVLAEAVQDLAAQGGTVQTPLATAHVTRMARRLTVIPVLRAGLVMLEPALSLLPEGTRVGFLGMARDEQTHRPHVYLERVPHDLSGEDVILLDVMIATGGSAADALDEIRKHSPASMHLAGIIAAPEGLAHLATRHPDVQVTVAAVDERLNEQAFIVPGLGDAGDRMYAP
ncbi:MAG: uracil phosphoribosyltransferase [Thermoleophilia bacterium]|nr:uracil phosphoribosyltransferase [Thermoleophilia bacterium]